MMEAERVVDAPQPFLRVEQQVPALAVGVVHHQVEGRDADQLLGQRRLLAEREVVLRGAVLHEQL